MKIVKLTSENIKRLRAVEITPAGELVEIAGKNGAGKTSILDSIFWAICGAKHIQAAPIRRGETSARIRLDLGELVVERRFLASGSSTLTVESAEGARFKSPQTMLDALVGALAFDPLAFLGMDPREQFDALRRIAPPAIDVDQLDGLNRKDFDRRTELNREAKQLRAQADGIAVPPDLPAEALDTAALMDRLTAASKENAELERRRAGREKVASDAERQRERAASKRKIVEGLKADIAQLEREAAELDAAAAELDAKLANAESLPEPVDADAIRRELEAAQAANALLDARARKVELIEQAQRIEDQAKDLTATMAAREQQKTDAIAAVTMPVEGLGFGDGVVTFNGVPFDQASSAEQLRVSVALAMAANPKLRVVRIKEGSLLDDQNVALIAAMARERDYQVWLETCHPSGRSAVVIEDGAVKEVLAQSQTTSSGLE